MNEVKITEPINQEIDFADNYNSSNPLIRQLQNKFYEKIFEIINSIELSAQNLILELGAGEGYSTSILLDYLKGTPIYVSSDLRTTLVKKNQGRSKCKNLIALNITNSAIKNNSADLVIALEVLEHIPVPNLALKEIARISSKHALLSVPFEPWWRIGNILRGAYIKDFGNTPDHMNHWGKRTLKLFLENYFSHVNIKISFPWLIAFCSNPKQENK